MSKQFTLIFTLSEKKGERYEYREIELPIVATDYADANMQATKYAIENKFPSHSLSIRQEQTQ